MIFRHTSLLLDSDGLTYNPYAFAAARSVRLV